MAGVDKPACRNCRYSYAIPGTVLEEETGLQDYYCRRFPPVQDIPGRAKSWQNWVLPVVISHFWCGEYERRK